MNALFGSLFGPIVVIFLFAYGIGYLIHGPGKHAKIIAWEAKLFAKCGRWLLKNSLMLVSKGFAYLASLVEPRRRRGP